MLPNLPYRIQIRPRGVCLYPDISRTSCRNLTTITNETCSKYTCKAITDKGRKNLMRCIDFLASIAERKRVFNPVSERFHDFQLAFITLTVPVFVPQCEHRSFKKAVLVPFCREAVRKGVLGLYVYVNELTKKGNIHFHFMSNRFVHYTKVRDLWNKHLKVNGYLESYKNEYGSYDPNSTDIKCVVGTDEASKYISKYMSKGSDDRGHIEGRLWDCSTYLKAQKYYTAYLKTEHRDMMYASILELADRVWEHDNIYFIPADMALQEQFVPDHYLIENRQHWLTIRDGVPR